jgi:serine/threonine-protein kinase HipA
MSRIGIVFFGEMRAGRIVEDDQGYRFTYDERYLKDQASKPVSLTLPLREEDYLSRTMLPFFDGLIPEGWLLDVAQKNWKLDPRDRMGLLLACCKDCIGAVSVRREEDA